MILNHSDQQYPQTIITLKNTALNNVENFKYLGAFIRYDIPKPGDVEINHRIQMAVSKLVDTEWNGMLQLLMKCAIEH